MSITFQYTMDGHDNVKTFDKPDPIKVGKLPSVGLNLPHQSVSRMHAYVDKYDDAYYVSDLGSRGGTYVDGQRVNRAKLTDGCTVRFGQVDVEVEIKQQTKRGELWLELWPVDNQTPVTGETKTKHLCGAAALTDKRQLTLIRKKMNTGENVRLDVINWLPSDHLPLHWMEAADIVVQHGPDGTFQYLKHKHEPGEKGKLYRLSDEKETKTEEKEDVLDRLAGLANRVLESIQSNKTYYCESCLTLMGNIVEMQNGECPQCHNRWRLNRGQARHQVSLRLQHYQRLADELGIK